MTDRDRLRPPLTNAHCDQLTLDPRRQLDVVSKTGSTNADLLARAASADIDGVVFTEHQTAGRGRLAAAGRLPPERADHPVGRCVVDVPVRVIRHWPRVWRCSIRWPLIAVPLAETASRPNDAGPGWQVSRHPGLRSRSVWVYFGVDSTSPRPRRG